jgi:exosortase/archaeosortase family protein
VEQYPVRSDVSGHNHGSGPDASGLILAKSLVIAVAVPLWVAKNGLRIFVLAMLGTRVDRSFLTGKLHHQGGIIYFLIALAAISFLIWIARYSNRNRRVLAETNH